MGNMDITTSVSSKLIIVITVRTVIIFKISAIIVNKPWEKILAIVSISFTVLVTSLPTAFLSKKDILNLIIFLKTLTLKSLITF